MRKFCLRSSLAMLLLACLMLLGGCVVKNAEGINLAVAQRDRAEGMLLKLKDAYHGHEDDPGYKTALGKYDTAAGDINTWLAGVKKALNENRSLNVPKSAFSYQKEVDDFVDYSQGKLVGTQSVIALVFVILDVAWDVTNDAIDHKVQQLNVVLDGAKWKSSGDVKEYSIPHSQGP